jgi:phosphate/phosphite/phosphonate ABC transporter binding protein
MALAGCEDKGSVEKGLAAPAARPGIPLGGTERPARLLLGVSPTIAARDVQHEYAGLVHYLSSRLGIPIEVRRAESPNALVSMLTSFEIQLAILPPVSYVQAKRQNPALVLLASEIIDGAATNAGYIVARDDRGVNSLEDLQGRRFGFVDRKSTTGYLYPLAYLRAQQITPESYFGSVIYAGDHTRLLDLVLGGAIDAGATHSTAFTRAVNEHPQGKHLRIIAKTGRAPLDAYCANPRLDGGLIDKLRASLLEVSTRTEEGRQILHGSIAINGFVGASDDNYDDIRRVEQLFGEAPPPASPPK